MIEALDASSPPDTWIRVKHIQGQLDAMRGFKHYIAADGKATLLHLHYHRNELKFAEEKLTNVVKALRIKSPVNYAHSAFALALTFQAQKKLAKAREIGEELIAHAVENNNADMLRVARAFAAELALRQGRLAKASRWVEKYHAIPFLPPFRFYMPQFAAVKILLAQDTTYCR